MVEVLEVIHLTCLLNFISLQALEGPAMSEAAGSGTTAVATLTTLPLKADAAVLAHVSIHL